MESTISTFCATAGNELLLLSLGMWGSDAKQLTYVDALGSIALSYAIERMG